MLEVVSSIEICVPKLYPMPSVSFILEQLWLILEAPTGYKDKLVTKLADTIWLDETERPEALDELLYELASDLDLYVPNEAHRAEDPSYYGDEKLHLVIKASLARLQEYQAKNERASE